MDVEQIFKEQFAKTQKADSVKSFLVKVREVRDMQDPDSFLALGYRVDTDQKVAIISKKASSNQYMPVAGGVLRAEKATRVPSKNAIACYKSDYFYTFQPDSLCLQAVIQASTPRLNPTTKMWQAQVNAFDVDVNDVLLTADKAGAHLDEQLVKILMPWKADESSSITHDVQGSPVWGDGATGMPGLTPFAVVRVLDKTINVYGLGSVKIDRDSGVSYRLPTEKEVLAQVQANPKLQMLKTVFSTIPSADLHKLPVALIPGLAITVGRDSLAGADQKYLAIPQAFEWKNYKVKDADGKPEIRPGYRQADVHIKTSRTGRQMVVYAAPTEGKLTTQFLPEISAEREIRLQREARAAAQQQTLNESGQSVEPSVEDSSLQKATQSEQPGAVLAETAAVSKPIAKTQARDVFDQLEDFEETPVSESAMSIDEAEHDLQSYAEDLAAIESMNSAAPDPQDPDDSIEGLLGEAAARLEKRRPARPTM